MSPIKNVRSQSLSQINRTWRRRPVSVANNPYRPFHLPQQPPPTVGLRTFGNSYPQSSIATHPISLTTAVRTARGGYSSVVIVLERTMAWRVCLVTGLLSALLSGCASVGNESIADATPESVSAQLIKGRTTQENVRGLYGDPAKTSFTDSGNETWNTISLECTRSPRTLFPMSI